MRSSYFLLFTLAAILPGLMLGAVLSRATSGTAAGPASVQSQGWPAPLEADVQSAGLQGTPAQNAGQTDLIAGLNAAVPAAPTGFDSGKFGTNPATGSSEQNALAMLSLPQTGSDALQAVPQTPSLAPSVQPSSVRAPAPLALPETGAGATQQLATAPRLAELPEPDAALALPTGLPEPLSLTPLQPLAPLNRAADVEDDASLVEETVPVQRGSLIDPSIHQGEDQNVDLGTGRLPEPVSLASLSPGALERPLLQPALPQASLNAAASTGFSSNTNFDASAPESWLEGVERPDYRPPQFVLLSFEAASRNVFWDTSRELVGEADAKATYFISASSLILEERAEAYAAPTGDNGRAWLGFAKDRQELLGRLERIQDALASGHDVAVQGVGYHRGQGWSIDQWRSELEQTEAFVRGAFRDNGLSEPEGWQATAQHLLTGFRAREQSGSSSLEAALVAQKQALYNASGKQSEAAWPNKEQGLWQLGLPLLNLDGARRVLAQDYDFYLKQTNGQPNGLKSGDHEEQMLALLLAEFDSRYQGARVPMPVSLHFALWNKGAYWRAVKSFAKKVCGQPEVICTTHREMVGYLDALGEAKLARLAAADFPAYQGPGVRLEVPKSAGPDLTQIASLNKSPSLKDAQAATTAARLLADEAPNDAPVLSQDSYVFDALPADRGAPLPALKPQRIADLTAPARPAAPQPAAQKQAAAPKQVDKPLPLPFAATTPSPSAGTRSSEPAALY